MFKYLKETIYDKTIKITIEKNKLNVLNYKEILIFEDEKILIDTKDYLIKIKGADLTINRLLNNELLVEGEIKIIEFG